MDVITSFLETKNLSENTKKNYISAFNRLLPLLKLSNPPPDFEWIKNG